MLGVLIALISQTMVIVSMDGKSCCQNGIHLEYPSMFPVKLKFNPGVNILLKLCADQRDLMSGDN